MKLPLSLRGISTPADPLSPDAQGRFAIAAKKDLIVAHNDKDHARRGGRYKEVSAERASGFNRTALTTVKSAALAPMPSAMTRMAVTVKPGVWASVRIV